MASEPQVRQEIKPGGNAYTSAGDMHVYQHPPTAEPGPVVVVGDVPQEPAAFQPRAGLMEALEPGPGDRVRVVFAVTGIRGVGKTQVAAAYARRRMDEGWRLVAWVDASDETSLLAGLVEVADAAGIGEAGDDARERAAGVRRWLEADGEQRLLVFDNADDLAMLRPFLPAGGTAQVIVTSSRRSAAGLGTAVPVDVFSEDEALAYLAGRTGLGDEAAARELAKELGCLPLGLAQAAALIARQCLEDYRVYLERLRSRPVADYLKPAEADQYPYRLAEAIELSLDAVKKDDSSGTRQRLMWLVSVLAETGVRRELLSRAVGDAEETDEGLGDLADASLLGFSMDRRAVTAHRLVMRVVRERLAARGGLLATVGKAVLALQEASRTIEEAWRDPTAVRDLAGQVSAIMACLAAHPEVLAGQIPEVLLMLRVRSADLLINLGDSTGLAIAVSEPLAADCERVLSADHPTALMSRNNLGAAYRHAGRTAEAIPLLEQTLAECERLPESDYVVTLRTLGNLAAAYGEAGQTAQAIPLLKRVLSGYERLLGADHVGTLTARGNLAAAYRDARRTAQAIPLLKRVLTDCERVLGTDHLSTLTVRNNLATAYGDAGRTAEAIPLLEQVLTDYEQVLGTDHPRTLTARNNLATAYGDAGRTAEAIPLLEQVLTDYEQVLGTDHPGTLTARNNLAVAYGNAGRPAQAMPLLKKALADRERVMGTHHPDTLTTRGNLASAYQDAGRMKAAFLLYKQNLTDCERVLGSAHPLTELMRDSLDTLTRYLSRWRLLAVPC